MTSASRRRTVWAFALVAAVAALSVHITSQIGRSGCIRHGVAAFAAAEHSDAPELAPIDAGDSGHAACALCAAPTATGSEVGTVGLVRPIRVEVRPVDSFEASCAVATPPPLEYAPKTSPPVA